MDPNILDQRLDDIAAIFDRKSDGGSQQGMDCSGSDCSVDGWVNNIKGVLGNTFSEDNLRNIGNQIKSVFDEHITEENVSNFGNQIKNAVKDIKDQDQIKQTLDYFKNQVDDKTGKAGEVIQCLQNDINDPTCFETLTQSTSIPLSSGIDSISIQGANLLASIFCGLFLLFLINLTFGRRI